MPDPLRVVHSTHLWLPRTETWLFRQIVSLPADRVESHVVCEDTVNIEEFPAKHLHVLRRASLARFVWQKGIRRLRLRDHLPFLENVVRRLRARVLHSHFGYVGWQNRRISAPGLRHVVSFYGVDVGRLPRSRPRWRRRYRDLFQGVDAVLCEGPAMADSIVGLGCPEAKVRVHPLGVSLPDLPFRPRNWSPGEELRVLIASTFREKKGIPYALAALARIAPEIPLSVTLVGDADRLPRSREEKRRILEEIQRGGLVDRVRLLGFRSHAELLDEAYRHHVFMAASVTAEDGDSEGGAPVALIEMLASGMPVVSTWHCDIPHVVQHGSTGFLAPERDPDALANCLRELLARHDEWPAFARRARGHVEERFDARVQGERLAAIYEELAEGADSRSVTPDLASAGATRPESTAGGPGE